MASIGGAGENGDWQVVLHSGLQCVLYNTSTSDLSVVQRDVPREESTARCSLCGQTLPADHVRQPASPGRRMSNRFSNVHDRMNQDYFLLLENSLSPAIQDREPQQTPAEPEPLRASETLNPGKIPFPLTASPVGYYE
ncbi:MAG: hypothetical protein SGCHY_003875, partial [Lobulomycetales sp.]